MTGSICAFLRRGPVPPALRAGARSARLRRRRRCAATFRRKHENRAGGGDVSMLSRQSVTTLSSGKKASLRTGLPSLARQ